MKLIKITIESINKLQLRELYDWHNDPKINKYFRSRSRTMEKIIEVLSRPKTYNFIINEKVRKLKIKKIVLGLYKENKRALNLYKGLGYIQTKKEGSIINYETCLEFIDWAEIEIEKELAVIQTVFNFKNKTKPILFLGLW